MAPKKKAKKTKAELEEERLAHEEDEKKQKIAEDKRIADENEKQRLEKLRIQNEYNKQREIELNRFEEEFKQLDDDVKGKQLQFIAEKKKEVNFIL
jgi:hypothetical protein